MKVVIVMRHAKTESMALFGKDFDRKLTEAGQLHASNMGEQLIKIGVSPDVIFSSNAARAQQTCAAVNKQLQVPSTHVVLTEDLYHAPAQVYYTLLTQLPEEFSSVLVIAHNPGITDFVNSLGIVKLDNMPTAGVFGFALQDNWNKINKAKKEFLFFEQPK